MKEKKMRSHHSSWINLLCLAILLISGAANAAFITDKIVVEVRTERFGQGAVLKKLPSGTSVEVLMSDGKYTRVRTTDNITGWVASTFLTNKKPTQLEYLELLAKSKTTEAKLRAAEQQLASDGNAVPASINYDEIQKLKDEAKNARWMKVEMQKARDRAQQAEAKLKAELKKQSNKSKKNSGAKQQLKTLRAEKDALEKRLAAAILINQNISEQQSDNDEVQINPVERAPIPVIETIRKEENGWSVGVQWFFGSLFTALIIGFIAGITWLDKRSRQRHGGFRIY